MIGGAQHPFERVSTSPVFHAGKNILGKNFSDVPMVKTKKTVIENDVWLGFGCIVKSGVIIHNGAVIGAGIVVTHDVPPYEIWAGNPAKKIKDRFDKKTAEELAKTEWWNMPDESISKLSRYFDDPIELIKALESDTTII